MKCPYPDELLEEWDGVCNPMGIECNDCEEINCEHNMNSDYWMPIEELVEFENSKKEVEL